MAISKSLTWGIILLALGMIKLNKLANVITTNFFELRKHKNHIQELETLKKHKNIFTKTYFMLHVQQLILFYSIV